VAARRDRNRGMTARFLSRNAQNLTIDLHRRERLCGGTRAVGTRVC